MARVVLSEADIQRAMRRIAHEILEANRGVEDLVILGIPTRGVMLADRIAATIARIEPQVVAANLVGALDVTMHRDDLRHSLVRTLHRTVVPAGGIDGKTVVLVDDVLYSGRTVRAAFDALSDLGRAGAVRLAVLVDRGHREFPIRADSVGKNIPSARAERVSVRLHEVDGIDEVVIWDPVA